MKQKDFKLREDRQALVGSVISGLLLTELNYNLHMPVFDYECTVCKYKGKVKFYALIRKQTVGCRLSSQKNNAAKRWTGIEEISGEFLYSVKSSADKRNLVYNLSPIFLWSLFLEQNKKCALSGIPISFSSVSNIRDGNASLDRIDNSKGYIEGNVRWVDKNINMIRRRLSDNDFIWFCRQITEYNKEVIIENPPDIKVFSV